MRIAISASERTAEGLLDKRFGRCKYFIIYEEDTGNFEAIENQGMTSGSGAGITAAQQIINLQADAIISGHLGPNAFKLLDSAGIKAYRCEGIPIIEAIDQLNSGQLVEIEKSGPAYHGRI